MEIKEVKRNNHNWIKELIIILVGVLILAIFSLRADAAENDWTGTFEYNGQVYTYVYTDYYTKTLSTGYQFKYYLSSPAYILIARNGNNGTITHVSFESFNKCDNPDILFPIYSTGNGNIYQICESGSGYNSQSFNIPVNNCTDQSGVQNAFIEYAKSDDFVGYVPEPDLSDIESVGSYSEYIPTPKITVDNVGYGFGFNNAADNYYFELQGRWYSVDDIELYKENLQWKYKYSTLIKSSLTSWVSASDKMLATDGYDFAELGSASFQAFLTSYPIDNRTYYGGTNAVGNYFSGYNNAMDTIKMLLNAPESLFNGLEIYIRYFTIDDKGNVNYGKWCHWYDALADSGGSSGSEIDDKQNMHSESQSESGLTTDQKESLEETGDSKSDTDVITQYINNSPDEIASKKIWEVMQSMISAMGVFPSLVSTVFGWLPSWLINMIAVSLASLIILRFLGR